eukprot:3740291-Rhodomonas_salina.1
MKEARVTGRLICCSTISTTTQCPPPVQALLATHVAPAFLSTHTPAPGHDTLAEHATSTLPFCATHSEAPSQVPPPHVADTLQACPSAVPTHCAAPLHDPPPVHSASTEQLAAVLGAVHTQDSASAAARHCPGFVRPHVTFLLRHRNSRASEHGPPVQSWTVTLVQRSLAMETHEDVPAVEQRQVLLSPEFPQEPPAENAPPAHAPLHSESMVQVEP